jgi:hypothetical protein
MIKSILSASILLIAPIYLMSQTFAEKLGYPSGSKVIILHVDDAGMSHESNLGVFKSMENGIANSTSIMMPCGWVPEVFSYLKLHPKTDAGLHLTLTSEWTSYRWGPLSGKAAVPGLVDNEGAMWKGVGDVVKHANADEVYKEIKSQVERSKTAGWEPTHLDSHMGTLFASETFLRKYLQVGMEEKIPVMFPGGHNTMIMKSESGSMLTKDKTTVVGNMLWDAGLPVLDDLHNVSYGFKYPETKMTDIQLQKIATDHYINSFKDLQPGVTMVIMHCTDPGIEFSTISGSGIVRKADMLAMCSPVFKKYIADNKIILTTWRELMERRVSLIKK